VSFRVTVRRGPKVEREQWDSVDETIEAIKRHVRGARRLEAAQGLGRTYEPSERIAIRIEIKGPSGRAGLDVLGDGGLIAHTGRVSRRVVGEGGDPYEALRAELTA